MYRLLLSKLPSMVMHHSFKHRIVVVGMDPSLVAGIVGIWAPPLEVEKSGLEPISEGETLCVYATGKSGKGSLFSVGGTIWTWTTDLQVELSGYGFYTCYGIFSVCTLSLQVDNMGTAISLKME